MNRAIRIATCAVGLIVAGCDGVDARARIGRAAVPEWRVGSEPAIRIGAADGSPEDVLYRVTGAVRLGDGRIVVANGGTHELRVYDARGRFVSRMGRAGKGPGEFESLEWVGRMPGDTLVAWDGRATRWSLFTPRGALVRSVTPHPQPPGFFPRARGVLADGSLVITSGMDVLGMLTARPGIRRDSVTLLRYRRDGTLSGTLAHLPGDQTYITRADRTVRRQPLPFARELFVAAMGARVLVGTSDRYRVLLLDAAGRQVAAASSSSPPTPVTAQDRARYTRDRLAQLAEERENGERQQALPDPPFPRTLPAFSALHADDGGNAWIADYAPRGEPRHWSVFTPAGRLLATVDTPPDLEILQAGPDFILGRIETEDGIEQIRIYPLRRS